MGKWNDYWSHIRHLLEAGRPEVTHTIDRIIAETGTTDKAIRTANLWRYTAEGRPAYTAAVDAGVAVTSHADENNEIVAVTFRLLATQAG